MKNYFVLLFAICFSFNNGLAQSNTTEAKVKDFETTGIDDEVTALKDDVINAKAQMIILKELVKKEGLDGKRRRLSIGFKNEMGSRYAIDSIVYKINGEPVYSYLLKDVQDLPPDQRFPKEFETKLVTGPHLLEVQIIYKGNDTGIFSYLRDYSVTKDAKINLVIDSSDSTKIQVTAFEQGWIFTDFKERPQLKVETSSQVAKN